MAYPSVLTVQCTMYNVHYITISNKNVKTLKEIV